MKYTVAISIGRDPSAEHEKDYVTYRPTHDDVADIIARVAKNHNVTVLATADGVGEYEGTTEPCTIALLVGDAESVDDMGEFMATLARNHWAQECIGWIKCIGDDTLLEPDDEPDYVHPVPTHVPTAQERSYYPRETW